MTTILIPAGSTYTAQTDIALPIVTTVVPNDADSSSISVVATADLAKRYPVRTIDRIVEKDNALYAGEVAPLALTFTSTLGQETLLIQAVGHVYGHFTATDDSMTLDYSPVTGKVTLHRNEVALVSQETYDSIEDISTLTFKTSVGGVEANYGAANPSATAKFVLRTSGEQRSAPSVSTVNLIADHQTKGISSTKATVVLPKGTTVAHNAPDTSKVYITFD